MAEKKENKGFSTTVHITLTDQESILIHDLALKNEIPVSGVAREIIRSVDQKDWPEMARRAHVKKLAQEKARTNGTDVTGINDRVLKLEQMLGELIKELRG